MFYYSPLISYAQTQMDNKIDRKRESVGNGRGRQLEMREGPARFGPNYQGETFQSDSERQGARRERNQPDLVPLFGQNIPE
eukprot:scaffold7434_cov65-Attheya_sp.AAC.2